MEITEIDGVKWVTVSDAALSVDKPDITIYKARDAERIPWRMLAGRIVVDLDAAKALWPQAEMEAE